LKDFFFALENGYKHGTTAHIKQTNNLQTSKQAKEAEAQADVEIDVFAKRRNGTKET